MEFVLEAQILLRQLRQGQVAGQANLLGHCRRVEPAAWGWMGRGAKPANDPNAFDAREVIQNLGPQVTRPTS